MVAGRREEHLRLVFQPAERLAVDDAIAVALKRRPDVVFELGTQPVPASRRSWPPRAPACRVARFELLSETCHTTINAEPAETAEKIILCVFSDFCVLRVSSERKLVPWARGPTPKISASVWPRSANVRRMPRSAPARTCRPIHHQRNVFTRMIGRRRRRIIAVIGRDDQAIVVAKLRQQARQPVVEALQVGGVSRDVVPVPVLAVEIDQVW